MNVKVYPHTLDITQDTEVNVGEYNVSTCTFEFSEEYDNLTKMAVFSTCEGSYKVAILNNECTIPSEVLEMPGSVLLGVYGYESIDETLTLRYSPEAEYFIVNRGSYQEAGDPSIPPRSEWEEVVEEVNQAITEANNLNIEAEKVDDITIITITKKDGTTEETQILDGEQGPPGPPGAVKFLIVNQLPTEDIQPDAIYLVPKQDPTQTDLYDEYMYVDFKWELLGEKQITVDLTDYVKFTDYASSSIGGVIKTSAGGFATNTTNGYLISPTRTYTEYGSLNNDAFIGKGTLENVITGKNLETANNKVTTISSASTDTQYPSAKCVYDIVGDIESILEELDIGGGI